MNIQPRKRVLDHADHVAPTRQRELDNTDHTDQGSIGPEVSRSSSGNDLYLVDDTSDQFEVWDVLVGRDGSPASSFIQ